MDPQVRGYVFITANVHNLSHPDKEPVKGLEVVGNR